MAVWALNSFPPGEAAREAASSRENAFQLRQGGGRSTVKRPIMWNVCLQQNEGFRGLGEGKVKSKGGRHSTKKIERLFPEGSFSAPTVLFM